MLLFITPLAKLGLFGLIAKKTFIRRNFLAWGASRFVFPGSWGWVYKFLSDKVELFVRVWKITGYKKFTIL
jgi:hypothetical protein